VDSSGADFAEPGGGYPTAGVKLRSMEHHNGRNAPETRGVCRSWVKPETGLFASFKYAGAGIMCAIQTQRNFRIHLGMTVLVIVLGLWLHLSRLEWSALALTIGAVLGAEIANTAAETLVDLASPAYNPLAKQVKDLAAGAVLVWAIVSVAVGLLILGPPLLERLGIF